MTARDPSSSPLSSPLSPVDSEVAEFLAFFKEHLAGVQFPDVDAETLDDLAASAKAQADELAALTERVRVAREALHQTQADLRRLSERGLAYVRVYADGNPDLAAAADQLALARDAQAGENSKPGRKRKPRSKSKSKAKSKAKSGAGDQPTGELPFASDESEAA